MHLVATPATEELTYYPSGKHVSIKRLLTAGGYGTTDFYDLPTGQYAFLTEFADPREHGGITCVFEVGQDTKTSWFQRYWMLIKLRLGLK